MRVQNLFLLVGFCATVHDSVAQPGGVTSAAPRPLVLLLHGRGQLDRDSAAVRAEWEAALTAGLQTVTSRVLVDPGDVRFVWYADVLDPLSDVGCEHHETNPRSSRLWSVQQTLQVYWNSVRRRLVRALNSVPKADSVITAALLGDVYLFLSNLWKRCGTEERLVRALQAAANDRRPIVLVAHSLGSLVVYSYLEGRNTAMYGGFDIRRLVTIGSMLSLQEVYQAIVGSMVNPPLNIPGEIQSWVNVRDPWDPLAFDMRTIVGLPGHPAAPRDLQKATTGGVRGGHDADGYLRDPVTARAIAWAWCRSFLNTRPVGCADVRSDVP